MRIYGLARYYPAIQEDPNYIEQHPIGMAYEKAEGYELIFRSSGFKDIGISKESMTFVSTDEEEWWRQMQQVGWDSLLNKIKRIETDQLQRVKDAIPGSSG